MRWVLSGIFILLGASALFAQAAGEVESIGFDNLYRPGCWTPMVVRLQPQSDQSSYYQLRIVQQDLDRDRVLFARTISLTGSTSGQGGREQRFWMYFIPEPTDRGLPEPADGLTSLQKRLQVILCAADGKPISQLPITNTISAVEPYISPAQPRIGKKMILTVMDRSVGSTPSWGEYQKCLGLAEEPLFIPITMDQIPDNVIGLEGVDAILLINTDPAPPQLGDQKIPILRQFVRQGGKLVVCHGTQWRRMEALGDLLPVSYPRFGTQTPPLQGMADRMDPQPLKGLAGRGSWSAAWDQLRGPFRVAAAEARPDTLVEIWMNWSGADAEAGLPAQTPWLVRQVYGLGSVTWVGQDLGEGSIIAKAPDGWVGIWDRVFGWNNHPVIPPPADAKEAAAHTSQWELNNPRDVSLSMLGGMSFAGKSAFYVLLAIGFFLLYWIAAGPGSYFFLIARKQAALNWFVFAAAGTVAAVLTFGVVKLVLRGPPQIHHWTVVRTAPGQPAVVHSRLGLYIPRGDEQKVELKGELPGSPSTLTAFAIHPQHLEIGQEFPSYMQYTVNIRDTASDEPPAVRFPYRSTSKKLEARWIGDLPARIDGLARLVPMDQGYITGSLTNGTPYTLRNIYLAFRYPRPDGQSEDWLLYLPDWAKGASLDLNHEFRAMGNSFVPQAQPGPGRRAYGRIVVGDVPMEWTNYWFDQLRSGMGDWDDFDRQTPISIPILCLFDRLPPSSNTAPPGKNNNRFDLLRTGAREMDLSQILSAGGLVVMAQTTGALPIPLEVEGRPVGGEGTILYQAVIPLRRPTDMSGPQP